MDDKDKQIVSLKRHIKILQETMKLIVDDDIHHIKLIREIIKKVGIENE